MESLPLKERRIEFALNVLHAMPTGNIEAIHKAFDDGKVAAVLDEHVIEELRAGALAILPVKIVYRNDEAEGLQKFQEYCDRVLRECDAK